jgi:hypothetical protein
MSVTPKPAPLTGRSEPNSLCYAVITGTAVWRQQEHHRQPDRPDGARGGNLGSQARVLVRERAVTDRSTVETGAIIGAGIGGLYLVAELGVAGFKLRLHDTDDLRLSDIRARGEWICGGGMGLFQQPNASAIVMRTSIFNSLV